MQIDGDKAFLAIMPKVLVHANFAFRHVRCEDTRDDKIAETLALVFKWTKRLADRGKDVREFPTTIAGYATRAVKSGRRLCGSRRPRDPLCPVAQAERGFTTVSLPDYATLSENPLQQALIDNTQTPPDEQAAFRIDFPAWRRTHSERNRSIIDEMMRGERTQDLAEQFGISEGRVSQLRRQFHDDWHAFTGEEQHGGQRTP
jgi:hypothetical protein